MDVEAVRRFFDAIAPRYDRVYARPSDQLRQHMKRVLDLLGPPRPPGDVLDLGVGPGPELHHLLDAGHRVVGIDVSPEMIALCSKRARPIRCVRADFWERLPVEDASFDMVIALFGSLGHAPHESARAHLAREVERVLRPGGIFYAEVPTPEWAAAHPSFEDGLTGARIDIAVAGKAAWLEAFASFDTSITNDGAELCIVARR